MNNWLELKTGISARLRASMVAVLTMALLLGPCLSITGLMGSGKAHAHVEQKAANALDHEMHGHGGHGTLNEIKGEYKNKGEGKPGSDAPPGCEEMCDGWAVQKSKRDLASALTFQNAAGVDFDGNAGITPLALHFPTGPPDTRRSPQHFSSQDGWLASVSGFAVTNRYRL